MQTFIFGDIVTVITENQPRKRGAPPGPPVGVVVGPTGVVDQYLILLHPLYREYTESRSLYISTIAVHTTNLQYF